MRTPRRGFTLTEMIAVLTLLLVLAGLAVPSFQSVINQSRVNAVELAAAAFAHELDAYAATKGYAPAELGNPTNSDIFAVLADADPNADASFGTNFDGIVHVSLGVDAGRRCAAITLSPVVGGKSTVASEPCA